MQYTLLAGAEVDAALYHLRIHEGEGLAAGFKFGEKVQVGQVPGAEYVVYDADAESSVPGGVLLVLLGHDRAPEGKGGYWIRRYVHPAEVKRRG